MNLETVVTLLIIYSLSVLVSGYYGFMVIRDDIEDKDPEVGITGQAMILGIVIPIVNSVFAACMLTFSVLKLIRAIYIYCTGG